MSWTGGKDCNLALLAAWRDASLRVAALVVFRPEGAVFRAHPLCLMEAQAASLGLPLVHVVIPRDPPSYKEPLPPHSHAHAHAHAHTHTHTAPIRLSPLWRRQTAPSAPSGFEVGASAQTHAASR